MKNMNRILLMLTFLSIGASRHADRIVSKKEL